jgi:hypothetical protein
MSKEKGYTGPANKPGSSTVTTDTASAELIKECLTAIQACLDQIKVLVAANNDTTILTEIETQLLAICEKIEASQITQEAILTAILEACEKMLTQQETLEALCVKIEEGNENALACFTEMKDSLAILVSVVVDAPDCLGTPVGEPVTYTNADEETEMDVSVGGDGDIKIGAGSGDGSESVITGFIADCLAAGSNVALTYTTIDGGSGSATLLSGVDGNAFPDFYNDSTDAAGDSGKVQSMTAVCLSEVEPNDAKALLTTDPCVTEKLCNIESVLAELLRCPKPLTIECLTKRTFCVGYDNGVSPGSSSNNCGSRANFVSFAWGFEVVGWEVNGSSVGAGEALGPFTGWTEQLQGWADFFNANDPNFVEGECFAEFGFLPAPVWRYTKINCCNPTAKYGPLTLRRLSDGCEFIVYPQLESDTVETLSRYATLDCDGVKSINWCDSAGEPAAAPASPDCFVPCGFNFQEYIYGPTIDCEQSIFNVCDNITEPATQFVSVITTCDGKRTVENWTLDSWTSAAAADELVAYEVQGSVVDCATGDLFEFPANLDEQILEKLCSIDEALVCDLNCPELIVGEPEVLTGANPGPITFPYSSTPNELADLGTPIALPEAVDGCLADPDQEVIVRWNVNHFVEASNGHTGANMTFSDGVTAITPTALSHPLGTTDLGPDVTPHPDVTDDYWADFTVTVAQLQAGLVAQTSGFGSVQAEIETINSQSFEVMTDLSTLGCEC